MQAETITISMNPEEALAMIIDAGEILDALASLEELSPGRTQGKGLHAVTLVLSVAAGILDEELFGGGFAARREISWVEADEEGIGFDLHS